ncbi:MAG: hypothetical protein ACQESE_02835 [Nanobdellota archaeon]
MVSKENILPYKVQSIEQFLDSIEKIYTQTYYGNLTDEQSTDTSEDEFLESISLMKEYLNDNEYSALQKESKEWIEKFLEEEDNLKQIKDNLSTMQTYLRNLANIDEQIQHIETTYINNSENQVYPSIEDECEDHYDFMGDLEIIRGRVNEGEYSYAAKDARRLKNNYNKNEPETSYLEEIPRSLDTVRMYLNYEQQSESNYTAKRYKKN